MLTWIFFCVGAGRKPDTKGPAQVTNALKAGAVYFAVVFAAGFVLGFLRVFVVVPRIGALRAVALELPIMLAVSWTVCGWVLRRYAVPVACGARAAMGLIAFVLLMLAELALAIATGRTFAAFMASLAMPEGVLGLSGQAIFAMLPLIRRRATNRYNPDP